MKIPPKRGIYFWTEVFLNPFGIIDYLILGSLISISVPLPGLLVTDMLP